MNVIVMPGCILCEGCGMQMGTQALQQWDPDITHMLIVCGSVNCLRQGKVLKFPLTRVNCAPAIAGSEKAKPSLVVVPH